MIYLWWSMAVLLAIAWSSRIVGAALGVPKVADISRPEWDRTFNPGRSPRVSIIVPARDEEETLEQGLTQLLNLDYENYEVIAVNDRSSDRTGEIMDRMARHPRAWGKLRVFHVTELPAGWMGKTHAMWSASSHASGEWLLFTDADVLFRPDSLRRAVAYAEAEPADHVVLFPRIIMKQPGEKMMIAFFQTLFVFGHRPWKVAEPDTEDHMGVGAFNLVRREVYKAIGTYEALRMEVLDDMKLGKVVKKAGFAQRNVFGDDLISIRWAKGAMGIMRNLTKNFFALMSFQWWRAVGSCIALVLLNIGPFLGVFLAHGWLRLPYAIAIVSMFLIYVGMSIHSSIEPYYFVLHPISTILFAYTMFHSMFLTLGNGGVTWRGTFYPLDELRRGMV